MRQLPLFTLPLLLSVAMNHEHCMGMSTLPSHQRLVGSPMFMQANAYLFHRNNSPLGSGGNVTHDKFCPEGHGGQPCEDGAYCEAPCVCDELAAARAEEREQA